METKTTISSVWKLIISILICELVGIFSGLLSNNDLKTWFTSLNKPSWNPPNYLFGPVWTTLYLLMGISLWLVWKNPSKNESKQKTHTVFAIQLFLNFMWSIIFFNFHSPAGAFVDILLLIVAIIITMVQFYRISKVATWLLLPYLLWVSFATCLNYSIWMLNF